MLVTDVVEVSFSIARDESKHAEGSDPCRQGGRGVHEPCS